MLAPFATGGTHSELPQRQRGSESVCTVTGNCARVTRALPVGMPGRRFREDRLGGLLGQEDHLIALLDAQKKWMPRRRFREDRLGGLLGQEDQLVALLDAQRQSRQESDPAEGRGEKGAGGEKQAWLESVPEGAHRAGTGVNYRGNLEGDSSSEGVAPSEEPERSLAHPPRGTNSILLLPPQPRAHVLRASPLFALTRPSTACAHNSGSCLRGS